MTPGQSSGADDAVSSVSAARARIGTTYVDRHDADPASILTPQGLGDNRGEREAPSTLARLLALPDALLDFGQQLADIRNVLTEALERELWHSSCNLMGDAGTAVTINGTQYAYGVGYGPRMGSAVVLRHIVVGSDTAGVVNLYASRNQAFNPAGSRRLATARLTATQPTLCLNITPIIEQDEVVLVVLTAASGNLDFACEVHALRSGN